MEKERQGQTLKAHELLALLQRLLKLCSQHLGLPTPNPLPLTSPSEADADTRLVAVAWFEALTTSPINNSDASDEGEQVQRLVRGSVEGLEAFAQASSPRASSRVLSRVLVLGLDLLTHLVEPLLTYQAYDAFLLSMAIVVESERVSVLRTLLQALPSRYRALVSELIVFLHRLWSLAMSDSPPLKLGEALSALIPSFIRPYKAVYYMESDSATQRALVVCLVLNAQALVSAAPATVPATPSSRRAELAQAGPEWLTD